MVSYTYLFIRIWVSMWHSSSSSVSLSEVVVGKILACNSWHRPLVARDHAVIIVVSSLLLVDDGCVFVGYYYLSPWSLLLLNHIPTTPILLLLQYIIQHGFHFPQDCQSRHHQSSNAQHAIRQGENGLGVFGLDGWYPVCLLVVLDAKWYQQWCDQQLLLATKSLVTDQQ